MKLPIFCAIISVALWSPTVEGENSAPVARKRGFSGFLGNYSTCNDAAALHLADSWSYSWTANTAQVHCTGAPSAEFVPMINGVGQACVY